MDAKNYIVAGLVKYNSNNGCIVIVKLDSAGNSLWSKFAYTNEKAGFAGPVSADIAPAPDGGFAVGSTEYTGESYQFTILKFDGNGNSCFTTKDTGDVNNTGKTAKSKAVELNNVNGLIAFTDTLLSENVRSKTEILCSSEQIGNSSKIKQPVHINSIKANMFPNPAKTNCMLYFEAERTAEYVIQCVNVAGKTVMQKTIVATAGKNVLPIDVNKFSAGTYIVNIRDEKGNTKSCKLVKE